MTFNLDEAVERITRHRADVAPNTPCLFCEKTRAALRAAVAAGRQEALAAVQANLIDESVRLERDGLDDTPLHGVSRPLSLAWACAATHARLAVEALPDP